METKYEVAVVFDGGCETRFTFNTAVEAIECARENYEEDADHREWVACETRYEDGVVVDSDRIATFK